MRRTQALTVFTCNVRATDGGHGYNWTVTCSIACILLARLNHRTSDVRDLCEFAQTIVMSCSLFALHWFGTSWVRDCISSETSLPTWCSWGSRRQKSENTQAVLDCHNHHTMKSYEICRTIHSRSRDISAAMDIDHHWQGAGAVSRGEHIQIQTILAVVVIRELWPETFDQLCHTLRRLHANIPPLLGVASVRFPAFRGLRRTEPQLSHRRRRERDSEETTNGLDGACSVWERHCGTTNSTVLGRHRDVFRLGEARSCCDADEDEQLHDIWRVV